jgi:DUF1009 family protein
MTQGPGQAIAKALLFGEVGGILKYFEESKVENIVIVGAVERPDLKSLKVDVTGSMLIAKIIKKKFLGDDNLLRTVSDYLESKGFKIISPQEILKLSESENYISTKAKPLEQDMLDIELGREVINSLGDLDVGQSVIVCSGYVLGIEAAEGTDNLIRRCDILRKSEKGGVLVKMAKSAQDMRLDVPVIGADTIFFLAKHGFNGIAIQKKGVVIIKPEETMKMLNESGLFLKMI